VYTGAVDTRAHSAAAHTAAVLAQLEHAAGEIRAAIHALAVGPGGSHLRDRVLYLLQTGAASTHSELMRALPGGSVLAYEVANALRDLRERGLVEQTPRTGQRISGRGRAPRVWRVVSAPQAATDAPPAARDLSSDGKSRSISVGISNAKRARA